MTTAHTYVVQLTVSSSDASYNGTTNFSGNGPNFDGNANSNINGDADNNPNYDSNTNTTR